MEQYEACRFRQDPLIGSNVLMPMMVRSGLLLNRATLVLGMEKID